MPLQPEHLEFQFFVFCLSRVWGEGDLGPACSRYPSKDHLHEVERLLSPCGPPSTSGLDSWSHLVHNPEGLEVREMRWRCLELQHTWEQVGAGVGCPKNTGKGQRGLTHSCSVAKLPWGIWPPKPASSFTLETYLSAFS